MPSKIQVDQIAGATGSTVTLPSGQTLDLSSGTVNLPSSALSALNASNLTSGTVPSARLSLTSSDLPTVPTTKGGTGLTTLGTAGQALKVNSGATGLEFGTISSGLLQVKTFRKTSGWSSGSNATNRVEVAPFDGSAGITPTSVSSLIMVYIHIVVKHGTSWRSGVGRVQFSTDGGSNYSDFGMMTSTTHQDGTNTSGNDYAGYFMIPNQNTLNEHKIRFFNMPHDSGHNHSLGNSSDINEDDSTIRSVYGTGATMTLFEYASSVASLSTTA